MTGYIQVPPNSTGKKVATEERVEIYYDNQVEPFSTGDELRGGTSGAIGTVAGINTEGFPQAEGVLYLISVVGNFVDNELLIDGVTTKATTNLSGNGFQQTEYVIQKVTITDPDNLNLNQKMNRFGASFGTFSDGSPLFAPFGAMTVAEPKTAKSFNFQYSNVNNLFWDQTVGGGVVSWESSRGTSLVSTGTADGDKASRTSHYYMPYYPGIGNDMLMSMQAGDSGKPGVVRRWGMFDDNNGVFFQLDGTTFSVVTRSNATGSIIDTVINQLEFNFDKLDGSDGINFSLDFTKGNIYWIDFQWLGSGRVRFGVYEPGGQKLVAHVFENANENPILPYMRTGTLPLRYSQENTTAIGSSSEMRTASAALRFTSEVTRDGAKFSLDSGIKVVATAAGEVPIMSLRPAQLYNGLPNRTSFKGKAITIMNLGSEPVLLRVRGIVSAHLTTPSFVAATASSSTEYDITASVINTAGTSKILTYIVPAGQSFFVKAGDDLHDMENYLYADGVTQPGFCLTAQTLSGTTTSVIGSVNWEESRV